jgi:hypothetical protein
MTLNLIRHYVMSLTNSWKPKIKILIINLISLKIMNYLINKITQKLLPKINQLTLTALIEM